MIGVILSAVCLSIRADTPSGPVAFEMSKDVNRSNTSGSEHSRSGSMCVPGVLGTGIVSSRDSGEAVEVFTKGITEHCGFSFVCIRCNIIPFERWDFRDIVCYTLNGLPEFFLSRV